ncbi:MAG: NAD(P)H-dependent glycerol-3-phosphate dehydrogenase [Thermodesulfobacteriota bacterium]
MEEIGVIGAGSWGTTLANLLARKGFNVSLWVRRTKLCKSIAEKHENLEYLPDVRLSPDIIPTTSLEESIRKDIVILSLPSHRIRDIIKNVRDSISQDTIIVNTSKGIEEDSLFTVSQVLKDVLSDVSYQGLAVLSGPSFAREVSKRLPAAVCIASENKKVASMVQSIFNTPYFRVYTNLDVMGVEIGGALKNVIAIASGICDGLSLGNNGRAALITRGLAEITRLGISMGARPETFSGLSGLGDLLLTCTGTLSRNHHVGFRLGKRGRLEDILSGMNMVAEGVRTTKAAYLLAKRYDIDMPITKQVYHILYKNKSPREAVMELMERELKRE